MPDFGQNLRRWPLPSRDICPTYDGLALLEETQWKVYNEEEPETRTATLELIKYKDKWYIENIEDFTYLFSGYY